MWQDGRKVALTMGAVALVGLMALACVRGGDEDRPPIIVKNGSVIFESQLAWIQDGDDWTPDQPEGKSVNTLEVSVANPTGGQCTGLQGNAVLVRRTPVNTPPLHVNVAAGKPVVGPRNQLTVNNGSATSTLTYEAGDLVSIQVGGNECMLGQTSVVTIQPK